MGWTVVRSTNHYKRFENTEVHVGSINLFAREWLIVDLAGSRIQVELTALCQQRQSVLDPHTKISVGLGDGIVSPVLIEPCVLLHD